MTVWQEKLDAGEIVILDGAIGSELEKRGVVMDDDAWCGRAMLSDPDVVRTLHDDYIAAGADVITTNTFGTNRFALEPAGLNDRFDEINQLAVDLARQACDAADREVAVAGSISTMPALAHMDDMPSPARAADDYRRLADRLAQAGCDLILCEMMMTSGHAEAVVDAARGTGLPVWIGFSTHRRNGTMLTYSPPRQPPAEGSDEEPRDVMGKRDFQEFAGFARRIMADGPAAAAGIMHSEVEDTGPGLTELKVSWSGPLLAYAHSGRFAPPEWKFVDVIEPDAYAEAAAGWVADHGVQIVGGCCGLGPDHIRALKERVG
ncbi:MAG: homocysteine S-methyltransferase family protein [Alphaproteobacteria bacterium]|jgi:S-methylmethionine-dependent homocysteine/selenocysteine methylase|nr:homocysteine S-methyltransferase family protein [Rhodospirillaceae bacterium]MBT7612787.1 homocysteine S-methyltransferase family protein [Rhodospirillaceae bacterium]MBT7648420.1 homocysteine S-methyltransferase family protein [Rhodospirillaceae bacterium]MDG2481088.1 homocysteine S-methyltransferase family protein [Alphaproteobacteria bacterium]